VSGYTLTPPQNADVMWTDANGQPQTERVTAGEPLRIEDPCEAYSFVQSYTAATGVGYRSRTGGARLGAIRAACQGRPTPATVVDQQPDVPPPAEQPPAAVPGDEAAGTPPTINPPMEMDPIVITAGEPFPEEVDASADPVTPGVPDGRPVEERAHDPQAPLPDASVEEEVDASAAPDDAGRVRRNEPTPRLPHYQFGLNDQSTPRLLFDPVDVYAGAFTIEEVDVQIPGRRQPLQLVRRYRSGMPWFGPWGFNWDHNFNAYARPLDDGWVGVWTGLLNEDVYEPDPAGGWKPPLGVTARLEHFDPDVGRGERYLLTAIDGTEHRFERPAGWPRPDRLPLVAITDRFGNAQTLTYDPEGRLVRITDDLGRFLEFRYGDCDLLEQVADSAGRTIRYEHDRTLQHLACVVTPPTAEAPEGARTCYEYDDGESHGRLRHNILRVIAPDGCMKVENEYGKDPSTDDFARVITQLSGERHRGDFRATRLTTPTRVPDAINLPALLVETMVDGDYRVTTFNFRGNALEERFRLARDRSWRLVVEAYRYDEAGNLTLHRRPNGQTTRLIHDVANADPQARANLLETWLDAPPAKPAIGRRILRATYEPRFQMLSRVEDESGGETRFHYGHEVAPSGVPALARVEHPDVTLRDGTTQTAVTQYEYDAHGRLLRQTSPEGRIDQHRYGTAGNENGYSVARVRDPGGVAATESYGYDPFGNVSSVTDEESNTTTLEFDERNRLIRSVKPAVSGVAPEIRLSYHLDGMLAELRRPRGAAAGLPPAEDTIVTRYEYDTLGRVVRQVDGANADEPRSLAFTFDAEDRMIEVVDALGRREEFLRDERGALLVHRRIGPDGAERSVRMVRDINGEVVHSILPGDHRIEWTRDSWDRVSVQQEPAYADGRARIALDYGDDDLLLARTITGPDGAGAPNTVLARATYGYDERGRLISEDEGAGATTTWFDSDGLPVAEVTAGGARIERGYDDLSRLVSLIDPLGNKSTFAYDRADRLLEHLVSEPTTAGATVDRLEVRTYDAQGRQITHVDPAGRTTSYAYDEGGRHVETTDPAGTVTTIVHNAFGELVETRTAAGGVPVTQRMDRDGGGRVVAFTDGTGSRWENDLDAFDAVLAHRAPSGREERMTYAADGSVSLYETPGGSEIAYGRRGDGALEQITFTPAGGSLATPAVTFVRDGLARLRSATQAGSAVERSYDLAGRLTEERTDGTSLARAYDDAARVTRTTYSDGRRDRFEHDELGRLVRIVLEEPGTEPATSGLAAETVLAEYAFEGTSRLVERMLVNGCVLRVGYDLALRPVTLEHEDGGGNTLVALTALFDAAGRRRVVALSGPPFRDHAYRYDELGRLVAATEGPALGALPDPADPAAVEAFLAALPAAPPGDVVDAYALDEADSRAAWSRIEGGATATRDYTYDAGHQVLGIAENGGPSATVTHDLDGRRTGDPRWSYAHDVLGRLREVRPPGGGGPVLTLDWDPLGRLRRVAQPGGDAFALRRLGDEALERDVSGGALLQDTPGLVPQEAPLRAGPLGVTTRLHDHRGSTLVIADAAGAAIARHRHEDFGAVAGFDGAGANPAPLTVLPSPVQFAGLEHLPGVGLYVAGERVYDPVTGRFLQPDPLGAVDSGDPYAYAKHDPIDNVDVSGLIVESAWDAFSLGVGVASLTYNLTRDNVDWWAVGLDVVGIVADTAALLVPGVPGGAGAAIKAVRAGRSASQVVTTTTRVGRGVRYAQAGTGVVSFAHGGVQSYQAANEGRYGGAALGIGLSALGLRGSLGRFASARAASRTPGVFYSMQGNAADITRSRRIWGQTNARVWAMPVLGAGAARTGMSRFDMPDMYERVIFEFTGDAARIFQPLPVWGPLTAWKAIAGQHATQLGDVRLDRFTHPTFDFNAAILSYRSVVSQATHLANDFAGSSRIPHRWRAAATPIFDTASTTVLATVPALLAPNLYRHEGSTLHPKIKPDVPGAGQSG